IESVDDLSTSVVIDRGDLLTTAPPEPYKRFKVTESGVSPRAIPGMARTIFVAASDEHREDGVVVSDVLAGLPAYVKERERQMEKRMKKMDVARNQVDAPKLYGPNEADLTLVCWGSTYGAAIEAANELTARGKKTNVYAIRNVLPFKAEEVLATLKSSKNLLSVECNYTGQMTRMIRAETGFEIRNKFLKYDGEPVYPQEIVARAIEVLGN
ncbi:MAG: 2-oxoacid:acceptor oxidoreductase subunit alpha, partial [Thaumarchaeota archaeon]|nr:2-oxoacid:acceptor oxidoreductase subunit alpha [Nitrososphaerota archaeon]